MNLSSLITPLEVELFEKFLSLTKEMTLLPQDAVLSFKKRYLSEIKGVLGEDVCVGAQGSFRKGTYWHGSDVDLLIDTGEREVTREEQKKLTERLKKFPELVHVGLGCVAIHFCFRNIEFDLVFSNLADVGKQPPVSEEEMEKMNIRAVHLAALALKVGLNESQSHRVANFLLERLVIHFYSNPSNYNNTKSGFELFLDVCQAIVDSKGEVLLSSSFQPKMDPSKKKQRRFLSYRTLTAATTRLSTLLHTFCLSRFFLQGGPDKRGFSDMEQIELWLRQIEDRGGEYNKMPGWLFGISHPENSIFRLHCRNRLSWRFRPPASRPLSEKEIEAKIKEVTSSVAFKIFSNDSPMGKYLLPFIRNEEFSEARFVGIGRFTFYEEVLKYSRLGSKVALRMLQTRTVWFEGVRLFSLGNISKAIDLWAHSLVLSRADGDPFSGEKWPRWLEEVKREFERDPMNPNAAIVLCAWLIGDQKWGEAERVLVPFLRSHPNNPGVLIWFTNVHGGQPNKDLRLLACITWRLAKLCPNEPMHIYWLAVYLRQLGHWEESAACYCVWLSVASPEGRKYPIALRDLGIVCMSMSTSGKARGESASDNQVPHWFQKGIEADEGVLPFLLETNSPHEMEGLMKMMIPKRKPTPEHVNKVLTSELKTKGIQVFRRGEYLVAIEIFSKILVLIPDDFECLDKRCFCYTKLEKYFLALKDGEKLMKFHPNKMESYLSLTNVHLGMKNPSCALEVCRRGLSQFSGSSDLMIAMKKAEAMIQKEKSRTGKGEGGRERLKAEDLSCYGEVRYKDNCKIVDKWGRGDYLSLADALTAHNSGKRSTTIVLFGQGPFNKSGGSLVILSSRVQIIGGGMTKGNTNKRKRKKKKKGPHPTHSSAVPSPHSTPPPSSSSSLSPPSSSSSSSPSSSSPCPSFPLPSLSPPNLPLRKSIIKSQGDLFQISPAKIEGTSKIELHLLNLELHAEKGHCMYAKGEVFVTVRNCRAKSFGVAAFGVCERGKMILKNCIISKSIGGIVANNAEATLTNCQFKGSTVSCLAIQNNSKCTISNCIIEKTNLQGVVVLEKCDVVMKNCEVIGCGAPPAMSGVLVEEGKLRMIECKVNENKSDGVVVQQEGRGVLVMERCEVKGNGNGGVCVFQGRGEISDCLIESSGDTTTGVLFGHSPSSLRRCIVSRLVMFSSEKHILEDNTIKQITRVPPNITKMHFPEISKAPLYEPSFHFDLPSLKRNHLSALNKIISPPGDTIHSATPNYFICPPRIFPDNQLQPMTIMGEWGGKEREVGRRSVGKVLVGRVCCPPFLMVSVMTVLEDEEGNGVFVAIYNLPGTENYTTVHDLSSEILPINTKITINEPFFHKFQHGQIGIRVESPSDIIIDRSSCFSNCFACGEKWRKKGGGRRLRECKECGVGAMYCGEECQKKDWEQHKLFHFC